ncbi:polyketide cyclase/dehydrase/lipid transport protein [Herbihabitans rhizosphaerae]|uniref:Polyketide cyclase/dehydrase/lipid transport protein n=1 Tax=Herbihabitans rhizosphaerae TaxID=1872711 RepID=A0A4Q7KS51_9PSEU|nr:SRPBCC family protein [Herbihabitans rhizosphaerae]RZS38920.1 polyketide cyclase/dehydrase/lipid transport protein [Herbihabitans rhizosphaerae]
MADESTQSIVVDASADEIMAVIADFPAYPEWAAAVKQTEVLDADDANADSNRAKKVRFTLDAGVFKDVYTLEYDWAADGREVNWNLVEGQMQRMQRGTYRLDPQDGQTKVTYTLSVQLVVPMIGLFRRKAEKMIMDTALKELKRRVEGS